METTLRKLSHKETLMVAGGVSGNIDFSAAADNNGNAQIQGDINVALSESILADLHGTANNQGQTKLQGGISMDFNEKLKGKLEGQVDNQGNSQASFGASWAFGS